jgi:hypothetical protein
MLSAVTSIDDGGSTSAAVSVPAGDTITADDIDTTNAMMVARAAAFARLAGTALVVVGAIGTIAWAWFVVRTQQHLTGLPGGSGFGGLDLDSRSPSLLDRIDAVPGTVVLLTSAALAVGLGVLLRLGADYTVARTGGSLTGYQVGDELPVGGADVGVELADE